MKVQIKAGTIFQDGAAVGRIEGRTEKWVLVGAVAVARFKYCRPGAAAAEWARHVFARHTVEEIVAGCAASSPLQFAEASGFRIEEART